MLMPRKVKHRKQHRGRLNGLAKGASTINFGDFGIQALEPAWITQRQIEAARIAMTRHVKRGGKVWIRVFPDKPVTQKPAETRMGSGKGNPEHWVAVVRPGPHPLRAGRGGARPGPRSHGAGHPEAPLQGSFRRTPGHARRARGGGVAEPCPTLQNCASSTTRSSRAGLAEYRREMLNLRFQLATGQLDNIVRISVVRKDVARVMTILRDREIALAEGRDAVPGARRPAPAPAGRGRRRRRRGAAGAAPEKAQGPEPRRGFGHVDDGDVEVADGDDVVDEEDE